MKKMLFVALCLALASSAICGIALAQTAPAPAPAAAAPAAAAPGAAAPAVTIPNPPMTMDIPGALPASFRGGNADAGPVNILEDGNYKVQEHSVLYNDTPSAMGTTAQGSNFTAPPTINWTTEKEAADGSVQNIGNVNNNAAAMESNTFKDPGTYRIHNGGARQVSGGSQDTSGSGASGSGASTSGSGASTGTGAATGATGATGTTGANGTAQTGAAGAEQRVTSNQTLTVVAHDCTSPSLWGVIQEGAGSTQMAADEQKLKEDLAAQMIEMGGNFNPENLKGSLKEAAILAIKEEPKNAPPTSKTAGVLVHGALFDETGKKMDSVLGVVPMKVADETSQTRLTQIGAQTVRGIFVRRNIPFLAAAHMTDNGTYNRDGATCGVVNKATGQSIDKVDNAYLFRVGNFPREQFQDQPEYEFLMDGADAAGNKTSVRVPLFVVNTQASFEGGKAE